ncbi:MAG: lysophospholipase [Lachnospiraceae bacterium]|nr:lysophospholipase [Lachnospiraceae bacterium]
MKKEFTFPSADKKTTIHVTEWIPEGKVRGVIQIVHGMCEHIERYDDFAGYLTEHGFYVTGNDHLGHGRSVTGTEKLGYFEDGMQSGALIKDMRQLHLMTAERFPGISYFILGHSMGSFLTRRYIAKYGEELAGALILGTGYTPYPMLAFGMRLCRITAASKGETARSKAVNSLAFGSYNKAFRPAKSDYEWLSKEEDVVERYLSDPYCAYRFTVNGFYGLFRNIWFAQKETGSIPEDLPVYILSGSEDPVGGNGKGVIKVFRDMEKAGIRDLGIKLYPGDRHEILNETNRSEVYEDIRSWLEGRLPSR